MVLMACCISLISAGVASITLKKFFDYDVIQSLRPIYRTPKGEEVKGRQYGTSRGELLIAKARPGCQGQAGCHHRVTTGRRGRWAPTGHIAVMGADRLDAWADDRSACGR